MEIHVLPNKEALGAAAAAAGADVLRRELAETGQASIIVATGASQFEMLAALVQEPDIRWDQVTVFHLDEYVGLPLSHPASFRRYLWERFHSRLPVPVRDFHYLATECDDEDEDSWKNIGELIARDEICVAFIGIGENAHIAFNDPPADFETEEPYIIVKLDEACRQQQFSEGWFPSFDAVPTEAVSMSIQQIMKSRHLIVTVPDERKARAVADAIDGPLTPMVPASILREHPQCAIYLDGPSASLLKARP